MIVTVKRIVSMSNALQIDSPGTTSGVQNLAASNGRLSVAVSRRGGSWQSCFAMVYPGALSDDMYPPTFPPDAEPLQASFGGTSVYQGTVQVWPLSGPQAALQGQRTVTLVVWPDTGAPAALVLNVTMLGGFATTNLPIVAVPIPVPPPPGAAPAPAPIPPSTSGPEITVSYDGTIPLQIFPTLNAGVNSCQAIVYPGDIPDAYIPRQPPDAGAGTTTFSNANGFLGTLPVGAVELNRKLAKTLVIWPDQGTFDPIVVRFNAVFNALQFNVPISAQSAVWFAWAPDGTSVGGAGTPIPAHAAANHRPTRLAVPRDATKFSLQAFGNWNPGAAACSADGQGGGTVQLPAANLALFQAPGLQSSRIAQILANKGALVGLWGAHPSIPTTEFLIGSLKSNEPVPKGPQGVAHPQPSYLFLGLHDADVWTDNSNDIISAMIFWDTTPVVAVPIPGPVIINEDGAP